MRLLAIVQTTVEAREIVIVSIGTKVAETVTRVHRMVPGESEADQC